MTPNPVVPSWVDKISPPERKRRVVRRPMRSDSHTIEIECDPDTTTYHEFRRNFGGLNSLLADDLEQYGFSESRKMKILGNVFDKVDDIGLDIWSQVCDDAALEFERTDRITDLAIGPVTYRLRRPLKAHISPSADHGWEYSVEQFGPRFVGKGDSIDESQRIFLSHIHSEFQSLVRLRPFQMNETQSAAWQSLEKLIDVEKYWDSVPVTLLETGVVSGISTDGHEITWLGGERKELIPIERTPPEFGAFKVGQWFEGLVERKSRTYEFQNLRWCKPTEPIDDMSEDEFRQWIEGLPNGDSVPESGTDWADL